MNATEMFCDKITALVETQWRKPDEILSFEIRTGEDFEGIVCWMGLKFVKVRRSQIERAVSQGEDKLDAMVKRIYYHALRGKPLIAYHPEQFTRAHLLRRSLQTLQEILDEAWGEKEAEKLFRGVEKQVDKICKGDASRLSRDVQALRLLKSAVARVLTNNKKPEEEEAHA